MNRQQKLEKGLTTWPASTRRHNIQKRINALIWMKPSDWTTEEHEFLKKHAPVGYVRRITQETANKLQGDSDRITGEISWSMTDDTYSVWVGDSWMPVTAGGTVDFVYYDTIVSAVDRKNEVVTTTHTPDGGYTVRTCTKV